MKYAIKVSLKNNETGANFALDADDIVTVRSLDNKGKYFKEKIRARYLKIRQSFESVNGNKNTTGYVLETPFAKGDISKDLADYKENSNDYFNINFD